MTENDTSDAEHGSDLPLTRRQALAGLGAGLVTAGGAASSIAETDPLTEREARWTARRRDRAASTFSERTVDQLLSKIDQELPDSPVEQYEFRDIADEQLADTVGNTVGGREIPLHTVDSVSQLHYLGARWDPHSNPTPSTGHDGAWQHTFVLTTLGAAQELAPIETWVGEDDDLIHEPDRLQFRPHRNFTVQPGLRVMAAANSEYDQEPRPFTGESHTVEEEPEDATSAGQGQEHVAVSARRDLNLFGFAGPDWLSGRVDDDATLNALFNSVASAPDDAIADYATLKQSMYDAAEHRQNVGAVGQIVSGSIGILSSLGSAKVIDPKYEALGVVEDGSFSPDDLANGQLFPGFLNRAGQGYKVASSALGALAELSDETTYDQSERRFYHGFEQWLPGAGPAGLGFVMFDVYVAPGKSGQVDVSAANRFLDTEDPYTDEDTLDDYPITSQTWRVAFDALEAPSELGEVSTGAKYNAEIDDYEFRVTDASGGVENQFPFNYLSRRERPEKPGPAITPYLEDGTGESGEVAAGSTPTFSAHDTALCRGPIVRYEWSIHQLTENAAGDLVARPAYDEQTGDDPEFSPTIEAPGSADADSQRVKLTVYDEYTSASTSFDFSVGAPAAPEPTISVTPEQPIVGESATFEADVDMPGDSVAYSWDVTSRPSELEHAPRDLYTGTGETFSFSPPVAGSYSVRVTASDDLGAEAVGTTTVEAVDGVAVSIDAPDRVLPAESMHFAAELLGNATAESYQWTVFGESKSGQQVTATFEEGDEPTASVTVATADGSTASTSVELYIPEDMSVSLSGPDQLRVGETEQVEATVSGAGSTVNYGFSNVDPVNSGQRDSPTRSVTYDEPGTQTVEVTAVEIGDDNERASDSIEIDVVPFPLSISGPVSAKTGESVTFQADAADDVTVASYEWSAFGSTHTGESVAGSFETGGEHVVEVTATTSAGTSATASTTVDVIGDDPMTVELTGPGRLEVGETGTVEASVTGADSELNYAFSGTDAVNSGQRDSPTRPVTVDAPGTHEVSVTATEVGDDDERASDSITIDVVEPGEFSVAIEGPSRVGVGEPASYDAVVSGAEADVTYAWNVFAGRGESVEGTFSEAGERVVEVTATESGGQQREATASTTVEVVADEPLRVDLTGPDQLRVGETGTVEASVSGVEGDVEYTFTNVLHPDPIEYPGPTKEVAFDSPGTHEVAVTVVDTHDGEGASDSITIDVVEVGELSVAIDAPSTTFVDQSVTLEATGGPDGASYEWSAFGETQTGATASGSFAETGRHEVTVTATADGNSASASATVDALPKFDEADTSLPTDTDGDGRYDDLNGDGELTHVDVVRFFDHQHRPTWKEAALFDFNGNEVVGHGDVVELFRTVATKSL